MSSPWLVVMCLLCRKFFEWVAEVPREVEEVLRQVLPFLCKLEL